MLKSINLQSNKFNKSIISCFGALPSLKTLDLSFSLLGGSSSIQELSHLSQDLEVLLLSRNDFNGTLPIKALASFHHLEVLDLSDNNFVGIIPSTIQELSSLRALSFAGNNLHGSLPNDIGLCELKNLQELDLSHNMFNGSVPQCFNRLSSLTMLDISSNRLTGTLIPSPIANLTSLRYVDFGDNLFEGSFLLSSLSNNTMLEVVRFMSSNSKFEVETEEPTGWIPMFQLKVLVISGCSMNRPKGRNIPRFLLHQHELHGIDLSDNSLVGPFPNWLIESNTMLEYLDLSKNSFSGTIRMPFYVNANIRWLDMSGNHLNGTIPDDIQKFLPGIAYLNLSSNSLDGVISSSIGDMRELHALDLSDNKFSGEVPKGLFSNLSHLLILKLSKNKLQGQVLSGNLSFGYIRWLHLDSNCFTGKIGNWNISNSHLRRLDIGSNYFTGMLPHWISNMSALSELVVRNNSFEGQFPCGTASFTFLDISHNYFSGPLPSCSNFQFIGHLHLGSNRFTGSIPNVFRNLTNILTLDIGDNFLSGRIPEFHGNLSNLRILILRNNNFSGPIPKQLCQLSDVSLIDLSSNSLSGSIPSCLYNIIKPFYPTFIEEMSDQGSEYGYKYESVLYKVPMLSSLLVDREVAEEVQFTTKSLSYLYKGHLLDLMVGLDLSCNRLTGEIPEELGLLNQIHALNLSHNQLYGRIPVNFSNLANIESLDLSSNHLSGEVPSGLIQLHYLSTFNVSYNNLSGNPLLCGPPLEKKCTAASPPQVTSPSSKEEDDEWYDIDFLASFYGTWAVSMLGFAGVLYVNPYWRRRWLEFVEECMYTCYYFLEDSVRKFKLGKYDILSFNKGIHEINPLKKVSNSGSQGYHASTNLPGCSFSLSSLSNNTVLEVVRFMSNKSEFEVETEEPTGWIPMFQLKVLVISGCSMNRLQGGIVPGFLLHQHELQEVDLSDNSLVGPFPNWLIEKNTMLEDLILSQNSFSGIIRMPFYMNANIRWLDMSGNHLNGSIPGDIQKFLPMINYLNLSSNSLDGVISSSVVDMRELRILDLSDNKLSGEVPNGLFSNLPYLLILKLSKNRLQGQVLSGNVSLGSIERLHLDSNCFTGKMGNANISSPYLRRLDIGSNSFTGTIPHWISNMSALSALVVRNNSFEGQFPCGTASFVFFDISHNSFSGPIPSCSNFRFTSHFHLGYNRLSGSIPNFFSNLTHILTFDIGNNLLSGRMPEFLGELSDLRILILRNNNFSGSIPKQLCQLSEVSLIDLSANSLSGSIPNCLHNIIKPFYPTFIEKQPEEKMSGSAYEYAGVLHKYFRFPSSWLEAEVADEVLFTTKTLSYPYKGRLLDLMSGLDLSCNRLTGEIPEELGLLTQIHALNLSHNQLYGRIPVNFSNLANIESLDLSSNHLSGELPSGLVKLNTLAVFNVSYNNLSGRLPEMRGQFATFSKESYEGNPLLCGPPLEKNCTATSSPQVMSPSSKEEDDKWYDDIDFLASFFGTWAVFMLGFAGVLYVNPYWRRRWLEFVEECMYTCYYFLEDSVRKLINMLFRK
ncbi:hypothetical protein OSB04_006210 [Centaurea solstitialis]|uniref:Disease resistance R13L4/SHOC-2-like LRR domain-containing protein n=1 Tax=Centaurea solstitialis TaxID=347529 RepID=A0AA38WQ69_9ASTR|nr:hypothetical protein OSB04_006210 [Centaurea solstitialis]